MTDKTPKKAKKTAPQGASVVARNKIDWEAVERDFRTGKHTQVELSRLHNLAQETLCRRIKADQKKDKSRWQPDLTLAVRQATNASLMSDLVKSEINDGQEKVKFTILAAAELRKQVIVSHRSRLTELADAVDFAKGTLLRIGADVADIRDAATLVQAVNSLATSTKTLIDKERETYELNDAPDKTPEKDQTRYTDAERAVKLAYLMSKVPA